jgi:hypothetical protein
MKTTTLIAASQLDKTAKNKPWYCQPIGSNKSAAADIPFIGFAFSTEKKKYKLLRIKQHRNPNCLPSLTTKY